MAETNTGELRDQTVLWKPMSAVLLCLRIVIGWQLLYEGLAKLLTPNWTAAPYLLLSRGFFPSFFHLLGSNPGLLGAVDFLNTWGLILIGTAIILGVLTRVASAFGILLLSLYYLAQPPLIRTDYRIPVEGHYLLVNKNLVELLVLVIFLVLPAERLWGLDRLWRGWRSRKKAVTEDVSLAPAGASWTRRETLENLIGAPILGVLGYAADKKYDWQKVHAITGATIKLQDLSLNDLKGELPKGTLKKVKVSRLILGGNLIGGYAHSRDLVYCSQLFKAYNTDRKVFDTLELAERAGINTFCVDPGELPLFSKYRELNSSKMQTLVQIWGHPKPTDLKETVDKAIDYGGTMLYIRGVEGDSFVKNGHIDLLGEALEYIKRHGVPAGIGAHSIEVPIQCEKAGLDPDYYVKTFHSDQYWSATPRADRVEFSVIGPPQPDHDQWHNNMFDLFPDKTIAFMGTVKKPWIAFKILAAGAFHPKDGFRFAFENGADFINVGMFDFQVVENVNVAIDVLSSLNGRLRPWYA
ncbi:MAG: DoxX family protein [Acidobacteria bacterium]|nr:DoxX family protein [Acidobacteriota bacterium]